LTFFATTEKSREISGIVTADHKHPLLWFRVSVAVRTQSERLSGKGGWPVSLGFPYAYGAYFAIENLSLPQLQLAMRLEKEKVEIAERNSSTIAFTAL
jgi:hypothetical protein